MAAINQLACRQKKKTMTGDAASVIATACVSVTTIIVIVLILKFQWDRRSLLHRERIKAIEQGQPVNLSDGSPPEQLFQHRAFWIAFWVGGAVPISLVVSVCIVLSNLDSRRENLAMTLAVGGLIVILIGILGAVALIIVSKWLFRKE